MILHHKLLFWAERYDRMSQFPEANGTNVIFLSPGKKIFLQLDNRENPRWTLPGGGIQLGELPEKAVKREVLEEMGLTLTGVEFVGCFVKRKSYGVVFLYQASNPLNDTELSSALSFRCDEVSGAKLFLPDEIADMNQNQIMPAQQLLISHYLRWCREKDSMHDTTRPIFDYCSKAG